MSGQSDMETDPLVLGQGAGEGPLGTQPVREVLQQVERQVGLLLRDAKRVLRERDSLLETLCILQSEQSLQSLQPPDLELVATTCESLVSTCLNVEINIVSSRAPEEELALHLVNNWIDQLVLSARHNPTKARSTCECYVMKLSGAGSSPEVVDEAFEKAIYRCSEVDRETVARRLTGLLNYIDYMMGRPQELE